MEQILNKIIEIDNKAKEIVKAEKTKESNIEEFIDSEFKRIKLNLDNEFKENLKIEKAKYNNMYEDKKKEIDSKIKTEINDMDIRYKEKKEEIVNSIIEKILKEE